MRHLTDQVLKRIEAENITPRPRWQFTLRNYGIWVALIISLILGTLSVSVIISFLTGYDWGVSASYLNRSFIQNALIAIPHLWVIFLMITLLLTYYNFHNTSRGYKHNLYMVVAIALFLSLLGGVILFANGLGGRINRWLLEKIPVYTHLVPRSKDIWNLPKQGLLGGQIISLNQKNGFILVGLDNQLWQIEDGSSTWPDDLKPQINLNVKIIGQAEPNQIFIAKTIESWDNGPY